MLNARNRTENKKCADIIRELCKYNLNNFPEANLLPNISQDQEILSALQNDLFLQQEPGAPFINPTPQVTVETSEFLKQLDLSAIEATILQLYKQPEKCKIAPQAFIKVALYYKLKCFKRITDLVREINANPMIRINLGLKALVKYKTVWHFLTYRLRNIEDLLGSFIRAVKTQMAASKIVLGTHVAGDSTPLQASRFDKEAPYNPYYKMNGYKVHWLIDTDHLIPLARKTTIITANDGPYFLGLWLDTRNLGMTPTEVALDGQYDSFENYAFIQISGAKPFINIPADAHLHDSEWLLIGEERIKKDRVELQLWEAEEVGKNARTASILEAAECPEGWLDRYHRRAVIEGSHGHFKEWFGLNMIPKGLKKVTHHVDLVLLAILAVALTRLQHGITKNLTGKAGLI